MKSFRDHDRSHLLMPSRAKGRASCFSRPTPDWLGPAFFEMIRLLAAQTMNCEWEASKHETKTLDLGETQERINALKSWTNMTVFRSEERAALSFAACLLQAQRDSDIQLAITDALKLLNRSEVLELLFTTVSIIDWNKGTPAKDERVSGEITVSRSR